MESAGRDPRQLNAEVQAWIEGTMRELRAGDLSGSVGLFRLKEELTRRVNVAVAPQQVSAVLFKEIVIQ